jgi:hypothetical protein
LHDDELEGVSTRMMVSGRAMGSWSVGGDLKVVAAVAPKIEEEMAMRPRARSLRDGMADKK